MSVAPHLLKNRYTKALVLAQEKLREMCLQYAVQLAKFSQVPWTEEGQILPAQHRLLVLPLLQSKFI